MPRGATKKKFEITSKSEDHGKWFQELLVRSDMIDYTDVSGCYVLKPWSFAIWEKIQSFLNAQIAVRGVQNTYFPMLVSETNLKKEEEHLEDFAPEVAWISTADEDAQERYAIRPTSETIIYPHFANWMKETGVYPKINQWCNILRWENKGCTPFIRSREFLWQEGHTCHPTKEDAALEMWDILSLYETVYNELLAVPMMPGLKTQSETFPGASMTSTIEGFLPDSGRAIQSATSHYLGTNFAKIFGIKGGDGNLAHQNSWGLTTRSIGIAVMTHSDDKGLVLPPRVSPIQVVLVACGLNKKTSDEVKADVDRSLTELNKAIYSTNVIRCTYDNTPKETPGMKFNKWEIKGVPLRIELGPRDLQNDQVTLFRRDTLEKWTVSLSNLLQNPGEVLKILTQIHRDMLGRATERYRESIALIDLDLVLENGDENTDALDQMVEAIKAKKLCLIKRPKFTSSDEDGLTEAKFEADLKAYCKSHEVKSTKCLCMPTTNALRTYGFDDLIQEGDAEYTQRYVLYGRSY
jgi:prolyl-tRNA synthetase